MSIQIPEIIDVLAACKEAYIIARSEYSNGRLHKKFCEYSLPKRKGAKKALWRVRKDVTFPHGSAAERMVLAAWDLGLAHEHEERDRETSKAMLIRPIYAEDISPTPDPDRYHALLEEAKEAERHG